MGPYTTTWLVILILMLVIEFVTVGLATIWFAAGALVALLLSLTGVGIVVQVVCFFVVSIALLIFTRPLAQKYLNGRKTRTNADSLPGRVVKVTETIDNIEGTGTAMVDGVEWSAKTALDFTVIPKDTLVRIVEIEGVKLIVEPIPVRKTSEAESNAE